MSHKCRKCGKTKKQKCHNREVKVIKCPTRKIVKTKTSEKIIKHIHPTEITHVKKTIIKNKHFYPVYEKEVHKCYEESSHYKETFHCKESSSHKESSHYKDSSHHKESSYKESSRYKESQHHHDGKFFSESPYFSK